jgi:hypothetical protein
VPTPKNTRKAFKDAYYEGVLAGVERENMRLLDGFELTVSRMKATDEATATMKEMLLSCFREIREERQKLTVRK